MVSDVSLINEIALRWILLYLTDDKSTLVQVMAWCLAAPSHYLSQCWPRWARSMSPNGVTGPQWVKRTLVQCTTWHLYNGELKKKIMSVFTMCPLYDCLWYKYLVVQMSHCTSPITCWLASRVSRSESARWLEVIDLARNANSGCANKILGCAKRIFWWHSPWKN